jgi:hypothetical protein
LALVTVGEASRITILRSLRSLNADIRQYSVLTAQCNVAMAVAVILCVHSNRFMQGATLAGSTKGRKRAALHTCTSCLVPRALFQEWSPICVCVCFLDLFKCFVTVTRACCCTRDAKKQSQLVCTMVTRRPRVQIIAMQLVTISSSLPSAFFDTFCPTIPT